MATNKIRLKDKWFRFIGIPLISVMSHIIFFNENHGQPDKAFTVWQIYLIAIAEASVLWEVNRLVLIYFRNAFPELSQSRKRIIYTFLGCMVVTILVRYINVWIYDKTLFWGYLFPPEGYLYSIFVGLLYVAIVMTIYEGFYYFQKWKQLYTETEALKRENLQTQLDSLKSQINPHFLFNNLSSISSLVTEDPEKAVKYINELALVYRYLLQANEKDLVTIEEEINFTLSYTDLLKTRFGKGIQLDVDLSEESRLSFIPPLTFQLLLENAVKHNVVLAEKPLHIKIFQSNDHIIIENNLQRKNSQPFSNKMGLKNIISKYNLLNQGSVQVTESGETFSVSIPIIKNKYYEIAHS
jgi:sensor histidine kinase YesM